MKTVSQGVSIYYVYECLVEGVQRYVGYGKGDRRSHCKSGKSSCSELNRDFHTGKEMVVRVIRSNLSKDEALSIEAELISQGGGTLYNKSVSRKHKLKSSPSMSRSDSLKILCSSNSIGNEELEFQNTFTTLTGVDIESKSYLKMNDCLTLNGLALYVVESETRTRFIVVDKVNSYEVDMFMQSQLGSLAHPEGLYGWEEGVRRELERY